MTYNDVSYVTDDIITFVAELYDTGAGFRNKYEYGHGFIFNLDSFGGEDISHATNCTQSGSTWNCYYEFTWKQVESWGCKFHDLSTGSKGKYIKPACDLVVDDKAKRIEEL